MNVGFDQDLESIKITRESSYLDNTDRTNHLYKILKRLKKMSAS